MSEKKELTIKYPSSRKGPGARFAEVEHAEDFKGTLKRIITYFINEKVMVLIIFVTVLFGALCSIAGPSFQSNAIDIIAKQKDGVLLNAIGLMILSYALYSLTQLLQTQNSARLSQRIVKKMREQLFNEIIDLPISYIDSNSTGDIMSRMTNDIETISTTISQSLPSLFSGILTIITTASIMFYYCWQLALLSLSTVVLTVISAKILAKYVIKYSRAKQRYLGEVNAVAEEMIDGYHTVDAYNHQTTVIKDFNEYSNALTKASFMSDTISGTMGPIMNCISNMGFVIVAAFGGYFAMNGIISVGIISAFIVYAKQFSKPINEIAQVYGELQTAIACAERVFAVIDEKGEDLSGEKLNVEKEAMITFDHINFAYIKDQPVIRDFSLEVPSGKKVALVGATGCGKTTIVNLLMRFYDVDSGTIRINDQDIKEVSRKDLRKNVAIVLQDTVLFSDTIYNNIIYSNENASKELVDNAIYMSRSNDMINHLPDGVNTMLTNSGGNISQGQRQLLAIARAFVADPKILILDEATSNVDTRTEKAIQDAMHKIMENRTSIIIAHRLSTIRDADVIVVMDHGQIVEQGNHENLLKAKGKYYELYMTQYAGNAI